MSVQSRNGVVGSGGVGHLDERKPAGLASITIPDNADSIDGAVLFEKGTDGVLGGAEIKVAYIDALHAHSPANRI